MQRSYDLTWVAAAARQENEAGDRRMETDAADGAVELLG